jgi:hypothetical protein
MPLKVNVGLSRKIGQANYGLRGASVNLEETETDSALLQRPEELRARIRQLFALARSAVDEELGADLAPAPQSPPQSNGNGYTEPTATAAQVRAIKAIARQQGVDLRELLRRQWQVARPEELTLPQASALIDQLKGRAVAQEGGHGHRSRPAS